MADKNVTVPDEMPDESWGMKLGGGGGGGGGPSYYVNQC